jgi:hypothetical protein
VLAVIERLVIAALVATVVVFFVRSHPFFAVPLRWRWLALADRDMGRAMGLRAAILDLLRQGRARHAEVLVADVDDLIRGMAELVEVQRALASEGPANERVTAAQRKVAGSLQAATARLEDLRAVLLEHAAVEADGVVDEIRLRFRERAEELGYSIAAQGELRSELEALHTRR